MLVNSKFKILPILIVSYFTILPIIAAYFSFTSPVAGMTLPVLFVLFVLLFWLTVFRTRAHKVKIDKNTITVRRCFGIGKSKVYDFKNLEGFVTMFESGKLGVSETIFILDKGERIGSISGFYHSNFEVLKARLKENLPDLGEIESVFTKECYLLFK